MAAYSGGIVWVGNNHLAACKAMPDTEAEARAYLDFLNGDDASYDRDLRDALYHGGIEAIRYYTDELGIPFTVIGRPDQYYPDAPGSKPRGRSLDVAMSDRLLSAAGAESCGPHRSSTSASPARRSTRTAGRKRRTRNSRIFTVSGWRRTS